MNKILVGFLLSCMIINGCDHISELSKKPLEIPKTQKVIEISFDDESLDAEHLPYFKSAWSLAGPNDTIDKEKISMALVVFYNEWNTTFGDSEHKLWNTLNDLTIVWGHDLMPIENCYDINGTWIEKGTASGLTSEKDSVWVYIGDKKISNTSLIHELIHVALWSITNEGDADHEGTKIPGWTKSHTDFINKTNSKLKELGL